MSLITILLQFTNLYKDNISFSSFPEVSYADGDSVRDPSEAGVFELQPSALEKVFALNLPLV